MVFAWDWLSVVDARVILPMELIQVVLEEPTSLATLDQAVATLKVSIEDVGFRCYCVDGAA